MILKPFVCGKTKIFFPSICSDSPYFTGTVDTTIRQGTDFDLRAGVNAYDADGMTIPFTVTPSEVEVCQLGVQSFVYEAEGAKDTRYITVVAVDNPTITGLTPLTVKEGEEFDPNEGVVATDGNGKTVTPTVKAYPSIHGLTPIRTTVGTTINTLDGVTATDGNGNLITVTCTEGSTFTPSEEGEYTLHYSATSDGMTTTGERKVTAGYGHFTGVNDTTVTQGTDFNLRNGVHAYDFNGNEVYFSIFPTSTFAPCYTGVQTYIYKANGILDHTRKITVTPVSNPTISGLTTLNVEVDEEFDPKSGVTATDGNGNAIPSSDITVTEVTSTSHTVTLHAGAGGSVSGGGTFEDGTQITVTATPNTNYSFEKWAKSSGGTAVSTSTSHTFTVTEDVDLYASFTYHEPTPITFTVTPHAGTGGSVSGGGTYQSGAYTTVSATPNTNYTFSSWRKGNSTGEIVSTSATYTFAVTETVDLYASFIYHDPSLVTEELDITCPKGDRTSAIISGTPDSGSTITLHYTLGSETGTVTFTYGTSSTKSVGDYEISYNGSKIFEVDGLSATGNTLVLNYLTYTETYYTVRTFAVTDGVLGDESGGEASGDGSFRAGTSVTVRAYTNSGYEFSNWATRSSGTPSVSTSSTYTFTINSDIDLYAMFDSNTPTPSQTTESFGTNVRAGDTDTVTLGHTPASGTSISMSVTHYGDSTLSFTAGTASTASVGDFIISYNGGSTFDIDGSDVDEETVTQALTINSVSYYY